MPTLMAFAPHPDDESYSFGGTLALAARAGWECHVVAVSSGEKGKRFDRGSTAREDVAAVREAELARSCELLGAAPPWFLRLPDGAVGSVELGPVLIGGLLRRFNPELVLSLGPDGAYGHPDHVVVHKWVTGAFLELPEPRGTLLYAVFPRALFLPQWKKVIHMMGEPPNPTAEAIGQGTWHYEVPIASVRDTKLAAIAAHRSQLRNGKPEDIFLPGIVRSLLDTERFDDASGQAHPETAALLASLAP